MDPGTITADVQLVNSSYDVSRQTAERCDAGIPVLNELIRRQLLASYTSNPAFGWPNGGK